MRTHLLDTSILVSVLLRRASTPSWVRDLVLDGSAATSIVVVGEALERVMGQDDYRLLRQRLIRLQDAIDPYAIDFRIVERYGALRRAMRAPYGQGLIGDIDTLIAATALEYDLTVVTMDRDFERVPDLKLRVIPRR